MTYPDWTGPARMLARAIDAAVTAAAVGDADGFDEAAAELRLAEPEVVAVLLGTMTQQLLERQYPDGLDSDDAEQVLADCEQAAVWFTGYDRDQVVLALVGTLGLLDPEQAPRADPVSVTRHGLLLIASLLPDSRRLPALVDHALREVHRAQTMELP